VVRLEVCLDIEEDCDGKEAILKRSLRSCGRSKALGREVPTLLARANEVIE